MEGDDFGMNCELPKLELKREELEARLATARLQGDLRAVDRIKVLLCKCDSEQFRKHADPSAVPPAPAAAARACE